MSADGKGLIDELTARFKQEPPRGSTFWVGIAWWAAPLVLMGAPLFGLGLRADVARGEMGDGFWAYAVGLAFLTMVGLRAAWVSGIPGRKLSAPLLLAGALSAAQTLAGLALLSRAALEKETLAAGLAAWGCQCALAETLLVALPAGCLFFLFRRLAPTRPRLSGALALLSTGAFSAFILALHCPSSNPLHVLVWHFVPVGVFSLLGGWFGEKSLRW